MTTPSDKSASADLVARPVDELINDAFMRDLGKVSGNAFEDAMRLAEALGESVASFAEEMGNGFSILASENKGQLVGVECLFLKWRFTDGDFGRYVNVAVLTHDGRKLILNDGSTGICGQLWDYTATTGKQSFGHAKRGLRESTYATCGRCGKPRDSRDDECAQCGDADTKRGVGVTLYIDLAA